MKKFKEDTAEARTVVLGVTGSVAAYKAAELVRELRRRGIEVRAAMTAAAKRLVGPPTLRALTGHPVMDDEWTNPGGEDGMDHISGSRGAGLILVAPASADFVAKAAHGIADDLLLAMLLARDCPAMLAPAMNRAMWKNPVTQSNVERLKETGILVVEPEEGDQACGESGCGRLADVAAIAARAEAMLQEPELKGMRVAVSAGATCEYLDPMRILTNASSGKMGVAVAEAARTLGADVVLVAGMVSCPLPAGMRIVSAETGAQMEAALTELAPRTDIFVSAAAVADYRPSAPQRSKLPSDKGITLRLERTTDILAAMACLPHAPYCVGFAAESEDLLANARRKRKRKGIPMIVANNVGKTVGSDHCELTVVAGTDRALKFGRMTKRSAAMRLMSLVGEACRASERRPRIRCAK